MNLRVPVNVERRKSSLGEEEVAAAAKGPRLGLIGAGVLVLAGLLAVGLVPRLQQRRQLQAELKIAQAARPIVSVVAVRLASATAELVLPGSSEAFRETGLYARTNGYLKRWLVDIGDHVKAGQLLAEIEAPEVDQELRRAQADLAQSRANLVQAQANAAYAQSTLRRFKSVKPEAISKQQVDEQQNAVTTAAAAVQVAQANITANEANVKRLVDLQSFQQVTAPFPGVITTRNVDPGALISAGSTASTRELFHLVQADTLRVFVNVPQAFVPAIQLEQPAELTVREYPDRTFPGKVTRTAGALDPASRTLLTEVRVPNADYTLLPGMYVQVKFVLTRPARPVVVPATALIVNADGTQVAVVGSDDIVHYRKVELGRDYGMEIEILSGLAGDELVAVNVSTNLADGTTVQKWTNATNTNAAGR